MSRFSSVESGVLARLQTLVPSSFALAEAVPADALFQRVPDSYPAALLTVQEAQKVSAEWTGRHVKMVYRLPIWIGVYASSDGLQIGDARSSAWALVDAVVDTLTGFVPSIPNNAPGPLTPDSITPFSIEVGKYGIIVAFSMMLISVI